MSLTSAKKLLLASAVRYVQQDTDTLPAMTANNLPAGHVASASNEQAETASQEPWRVFNKSTTSSVGADYVWTAPATGWIQRRTPSPIRLWRFGIRHRLQAADQALRNFSLYGSNDGVNFTLLRSVAGQVNWTDAETRLFEIPKLSRKAYLVHRLVIESNNGSSSTAIDEVLFYQEVRA